MAHCTVGQGTENERLNQIIDRVLNHMLGHEAAQSFYDHLEDTHAIQRHKIAQELGPFSEALREYLGSGAIVIEHMIRKNLELGELEDEARLLGKTRILKLV